MIKLLFILGLVILVVQFIRSILEPFNLFGSKEKYDNFDAHKTINSKIMQPDNKEYLNVPLLVEVIGNEEVIYSRPIVKDALVCAIENEDVRISELHNTIAVIIVVCGLLICFVLGVFFDSKTTVVISCMFLALSFMWMVVWAYVKITNTAVNKKAIPCNGYVVLTSKHLITLSAGVIKKAYYTPEWVKSNEHRIKITEHISGQSSCTETFFYFNHVQDVVNEIRKLRSIKVGV